MIHFLCSGCHNVIYLNEEIPKKTEHYNSTSPIASYEDILKGEKNIQEDLFYETLQTTTDKLLDILRKQGVDIDLTLLEQKNLADLTLTHQVHRQQENNHASLTLPISPRFISQKTSLNTRFPSRLLDVLDTTSLQNSIEALELIKTSWLEKDELLLRTNIQSSTLDHQPFKAIKPVTTQQCDMDENCAPLHDINNMDKSQMNPENLFKLQPFLCMECLREIGQHLQEAISLCEKEISMYIDFISKFLNRFEQNISETKKTLTTLKTNPQQSLMYYVLPSFVRLKKYRMKPPYLKKRFLKLNHTREKAGLREPCIYAQLMKRQAETVENTNRLASLEATVYSHNALLCVMLKYNAMKDTFNIWTQGPYGVINGLRLGKLPNDFVTWDEVNAAWGVTAFCLDSLIQLVVTCYCKFKQAFHENRSKDGSNMTKPRLGDTLKDELDFKQFKYLNAYRILPRGNQSIIVKRSDSSIFELYGSPGSLIHFFATRRFNTAMLIVLEISKEILILITSIHSYLAPNSKRLCPPFQITSETVGNASIHLPSYAGSEVWCRCLKYLLLNFKWFILVEQEFQSVWSSGKMRHSV